MKRLLPIVIVVAIAIGVTASVSAQSDVMVIEFTEPPDLDGPPDRVVVFVGETACAEARFDADSPPSVVLGADDQPSSCDAAGAEVSFLQILSTGQPLQLFVRVPFVPGSQYEVANWAPQPPGSMLPSYMQAFLDAGAVVRPATSGNAGLKPIPESTSVATVGLLVSVSLIAVGRRLTAAHPGRE